MGFHSDMRSESIIGECIVSVYVSVKLRCEVGYHQKCMDKQSYVVVSFNK